VKKRFYPKGKKDLGYNHQDFQTFKGFFLFLLLMNEEAKLPQFPHVFPIAHFQLNLCIRDCFSLFQTRGKDYHLPSFRHRLLQAFSSAMAQLVVSWLSKLRKICPLHLQTLIELFWSIFFHPIKLLNLIIHIETLEFVPIKCFT
jgi:hypothetical protein